MSAAIGWSKGNEKILKWKKKKHNTLLII